MALPSKGKKKGYKKNVIEIRDTIMEPFHIVRDDKQFIVMTDSSTIPAGYFSKLGNALDFISKNKMLHTNAGSVLSLRSFINTYEETSQSLINAVKI